VILEELLGEFIVGPGGYWLDSCLEASYVFADVPEYRPSRPIYLKSKAGNSTGDADDKKETNFFIDTPNYSELG